MGLLDAVTGGWGKGPNLQIWGHERGLDYLGEPEEIYGIPLKTRGERPTSVCVGKVCDEAMGVVFHDYDPSQGEGDRTEHYTRLAVKLPEALAPVQALLVGNGTDLQVMAGDWQPTPEYQALDPAALGLGPAASRRWIGSVHGWQVVTALAADTDLVAAVLGGELGDALRNYSGEFALDYRNGTLMFAHWDEHLGPGPELDAAHRVLCVAHRELRSAALAKASPQPFETALREPEWVNAPPPEPPKERKVLGVFKVVEMQGPVVSMRQRFDPFARGAAYEDPLAFHAAFPSNPAPGNAWVVWRKENGGRPLRVAIHAESHRLHRGPCVVLMEVNGSAQDRPAPITTEAGALSIAVEDGLMAAWMYRDENNFTPELIDLIESQAIAVAEQQGWLA